MQTLDYTQILPLTHAHAADVLSHSRKSRNLFLDCGADAARTIWTL